MASTHYHGALYRIRHTGGAVRVTMASNVGQGNGGTSLPCAGCYISAPSENTAPTRWNIGAAASATAGCEISEQTSVYIPIDDVSQLYFYTGGASDIVDIVYLR